MITAGGKRVGQPGVNGSAVMLDGGNLAVHDAPGANDLPAEGVADGLMPQADAHERHRRVELTDDIHRNARLARRTGAGRQENRLRLELLNALQGDFIVAVDLDIFTHLSQV